MAYIYCENCEWELVDKEGRETGLCEECRDKVTVESDIDGGCNKHELK